MAKLKITEVIAKILKEEGVEWYAGVHGGHVWELMNAIGREGIKLYHMRHEQSGVYTAEGWARTTGRPGICFGTAGPGFTNMISGLHQAYLTRSPVVALVGQHIANLDGWGPFQEAYAEPLCKEFTKWTKRIIDPSTAAYFMQKAFRDATTYPQGPIVLEFPRDILSQTVEEADALRGYLPKGLCATPSQPAGDPAMIEKAVRMLLKAKNPIIMGGDGIFWSKASEELKELVELLNIPVVTRRMGRGAIPESHPLAFGGGLKSRLLKHADVVAIFGLRMNSLEHFGMPPGYPAEGIRYIQVSEDFEELTTRIPTEVSIFANPKLALRQMIDCVKDLIDKKPERNMWIDKVRKTKEDFLNKTKDHVESIRNNSPLHPDYLAAEVFDFLDNDATVILDSFSLSGFATDKISASFAGQVLDAATWGGVGHGVGMAIGAQLGRPGKQVLALLGDGGIGVAGWDIETAARHNIPACYLIYNNSSWIGDYAQPFACPDVKESWGMLKDIRYDKIFAELGCHSELVTEPEQIRPALARAFNSGKTSVINVIPDNTIMAPHLKGRLELYKS